MRVAQCFLAALVFMTLLRLWLLEIHWSATSSANIVPPYAAMAAFMPHPNGSGARTATLPPGPASLRPAGCEQTRRHVYLDLGANWGNTARMHERFAAPTELAAGVRWEVYGFEASPLIQPYVSDLYAHLRGELAEPLLCLPKSGSTGDLVPYAQRLGCPTGGASTVEGNARDKDAAMKQCIFEVFAKPLAALRPRPALNDSSVIQQALAASGCASASASARHGAPHFFSLVPAAASGEPGWLQLYSPPQQLIRGGARPDADGTLRVSGQDGEDYRFTVPVVDVAGWMVATLTEGDYVVAKMDIEGSEHSLLRSLMSKRALHLIDVLAYECHSNAGDCRQLRAAMAEAAPQMHVWVDGRNYTGLDAYSRVSTQSSIEFERWRERCGLVRASVSASPK